MAKKKTKKGTTVKARTKSEVIGALAEANDMSRKDVNAFFESMGKMIKKDLGRSGPGIFNVPGMMKIKVVRKPATKARLGINPFTKEEMVFKAKLARNVVEVRAVKGLKDMV